MPRVVHLEIFADDPERATQFYEKVFGREITKWEGPVDHWLVTTGGDEEPGINGPIARRSGDEGTWNTIAVPSVDEFSQRVVKAGGKVVQEKVAIPGLGYQAYCLDTEGNMFGIHEENPAAH